MNLLSKTVLSTALGVVLFGCGNDIPREVTFNTPERELENFSDSLVVEPLNLGSPIAGVGSTYDTSIMSSAFSMRDAGRSVQEVINNVLVNNRLFEVSTDEKWALRVDNLELDYSNCSLTAEQIESTNKEVLVSVYAAASNVGQLSLSSLTAGQPAYFDVSDLEDGDFVKIELDVLPSSCSNISATLTYALSDEGKPKVDEEIEGDELTDEEKAAIDNTEYDSLTYSVALSETSAADVVTYSRNSVKVLSFNNLSTSFAKVLFLEPELDKCGLNVPEAFAASEVLRINITAESIGGERLVVGSDVLDSEFNYSSIDYSAYDKAFIEVDNVPASCESVIVRLAHWLGTDEMSPEPMRECSLRSNPSSSTVTWAPDIEGFVINDSSGANVLNESDLCSSSNKSFLREDSLGSNVEVVTEGEGDDEEKTYYLLLDGERVSEISCSFTGRLNFIHDPAKLLCADKILDADEVASRRSSQNEDVAALSGDDIVDEHGSEEGDVVASDDINNEGE